MRRLSRAEVFLGAVILVAVTATAFGATVRAPTTEDPQTGGPGNLNTTIAFEEVAAESGFTYEAATGGKGAAAMISDVGVYAADVNRDGWTDLLVTGGERPVLFENTGGKFKRAGALPRLNRSVRSALFVDYDADGWEDLLLLSDGRRPLLLANDDGSFERATAGFERSLSVPVGATTADYNHDGCPDVYVIQNGQWSRRAPMGMVNESVPLDADNGRPNVLYAGTCSGFQRANASGIRGTRWSLATSFVDLTGDGWPDIHVANDFNRDILYVNQRDGTFDRVVLPARTDRNGMSSEVADVTGDGRLDVFTGNIYYPQMIKDIAPEGQAVRADGNTLLVNRGNGTFVDRAEGLGVRRGGWAWAAVLADFDNDMDQDLFHTTKRMRFRERLPLIPLSEGEVDRLLTEYPAYQYPLVRERTDEGYVVRRADDAGFEITDGRGVARLDFDRDGDIDLAVANAEGTFKLYRNEGQTGSSLQVVLRGSNQTLPLGATVTVTAGTETQVRRYHASTDFLSQDSRVLHFGTGTHEAVDVTVEWPDGTTDTLRGVRTGQFLVLTPEGRVSVGER